MPQLKRLAPDATDATPERLFAQALHDATQRELRKAAAAACAAPACTMASRLDESEPEPRSYIQLRDEHELSSRLVTMPLDESVRCAIHAAKEDRATSIFVVDSAIYVAKCIRNVLDVENVDSSAREAILCRLWVHQTREIHILLSVLDDIQSRGPDRPAHVFIGPMCGFFTQFLTHNGLTTTGDGLLRMIQLACKRFQSNGMGTKVTIIRERPLLESLPLTS